MIHFSAMRRFLLVLVFTTISLLGADLSGKWRFDVETDAGSGTPTFILKQTGETLSGSYSGALGEASVTGSVKGNKVRIEFQASDAKVVYDGVVDEAGNLKGTVDLGGQAKGTFTGSRSK